MTLYEQLLDAARKLEAETFTLQTLVVQAWRMFPGTFGLHGFRQYPDSNKVITVIAGRSGLVARGCLERVGPNQFAYRHSNLHPPRNGRQEKTGPPRKLPEPEEIELRIWREGACLNAVQKYMQRVSSDGEVTYRDAHEMFHAAAGGS